MHLDSNVLPNFYYYSADTLKSLYLFQVYRDFLRNATDGFPRVIYFGEDDGHQLKIMALELLGPSLQTLFVNCDRRFSLKTVLMMFDQMTTRIEQMHEKRLIHRDIKPENFLIGSTSSSTQLYLIDFGLTFQYKNRSDDHVTCTRGNNFIGTTRYASINAHRGIQQSRRDDLESLGYMILYFLKGTLPWQNVYTQVINRKQECERALELKLSTKVDVLCQQLPIEFRIYIMYCRSRKFEETPDYEYIRRMFRYFFWFLVIFSVKIICLTILFQKSFS